MTKSKMLTAAALPALLALGLSACAGEQAEDQAETQSDAQVAYDDAQSSQAGDDADKENEAYAGTAQAGAYVSQNEEAAETAPAGVGDNIITVAEIREPSDINEMIDVSFERADLNNDGSLDRTEYSSLAASLQIADAGDTLAEARDRALDQAEKTMDSMTADDSLGSEDAAAIEERSVLPGEELFAEAAGADDKLSKEDLRTTFLSRFEIADADGDQVLDETERREFLRIANVKNN